MYRLEPVYLCIYYFEQLSCITTCFFFVANLPLPDIIHTYARLKVSVMHFPPEIIRKLCQNKVKTKTRMFTYLLIYESMNEIQLTNT